MTMLEERLRTGLAAEAQAWPDPPSPGRSSRSASAPGLKVALIAAAAVLVVVGGITLAGRLGNTDGTELRTAAPVPAKGFSAAEAEIMPVRTAEYEFSVEEWSRQTAYGNSRRMAFPADEITEDLRTVIRREAGIVLSNIDARPPYEVTVITARFSSTWDAEVLVNHAAGTCLMVIEQGLGVFSDCVDGGDPVVSKWLVDESGVVDSRDAGGSAWVQFVWWGLPASAVDVLSWRDAGEGAEPKISSTPVLGGTAWITRPVAGVEQLVRVQARDAEGVVVLENVLTVPAATPGAFDAADTADALTYASDADRFADLVKPGEAFLGGGAVLGENWAIVGTSGVEPGKTTLPCIGVRPIVNEDFCDSGDYLGWQVLPVGDGGVVVFQPPPDAIRVQVSFADGRVVDIPVLGSAEGYPPIAVVSVEHVGQAGTALAINDNGDVLYRATFSVEEFAMPQG